MSDRAKYWAQLLGAWEKSGLTQAEFCRRRGVKAVTFAWWKRRLRGVAEWGRQRSGRSTASRRRREATFTEVMWPDRVLAGGAHRVSTGGAPVPAVPESHSLCFTDVQATRFSGAPIAARPEPPSGGYEIVLADGLGIRLPGDFDPEKVAQLLRLVVPAC